MHLLAITVTPKSDADQEKFLAGLQTLTAEDQSLLTFRMSRVPDTGRLQFTIATSSEDKLEWILDRFRREFQVEATLGKPHVTCPHDLEPVMLVEIVTPEEHLGDILGDLNHRRGRILSLSEHNHLTEISAHVPLSDLLGYTTSLHQRTSHRATVEITFDHYRSRDHWTDAPDDDRTSSVGAPRRPTGPRNISAIALPEPDDDDPHDQDDDDHHPFVR